MQSCTALGHLIHLCICACVYAWVCPLGLQRQFWKRLTLIYFILENIKRKIFFSAANKFSENFSINDMLIFQSRKKTTCNLIFMEYFHIYVVLPLSISVLFLFRTSYYFSCFLIRQIRRNKRREQMVLRVCLKWCVTYTHTQLCQQSPTPYNFVHFHIIGRLCFKSHGWLRMEMKSQFIIQKEYIWVVIEILVFWLKNWAASGRCINPSWQQFNFLIGEEMAYYISKLISLKNVY